MLSEREPTRYSVIYAFRIGSSMGITTAHSERTQLHAGEERKALSEDLKKGMEHLQRRGTRPPAVEEGRRETEIKGEL